MDRRDATVETVTQAERLGQTGRGPSFHGQSGLAVVLAVALYLAILVLRFAVESTQDEIGLLMRRSEDERRRFEAAARRHRDAVEFNDSVIQRLSAAKWALESGRQDRGLEIVTRTLSEAEQVVTELLRDADMGPDGLRGQPRARETDRIPRRTG